MVQINLEINKIVQNIQTIKTKEMTHQIYTKYLLLDLSFVE